MYDVAKRLDELIEGSGMTVYEIAKIAGIPRSTIYTYQYKGYFPPIDKLERICEAMGLTLVDFFIETETRVETNEAVVSKWQCLDDDEKAAVMAVIDTMIARKLFGKKH